MTDLPRIGFIGAGRTATALALALSRAGYDVVAVSSRSDASARELASRLPHWAAPLDAQSVVDKAGLVFITTPDEAIRSSIDALRWRPGVAVVHCSGALTREELSSAAAQGAETGCLHPLQTFASRETSAGLRGVYFAVEADGALDATLRAMAEALGGTPITLRAEDRALYHASAVLASNYVVTLLKLAADLWQHFGYSQGTASLALQPLLHGTIENIGAFGIQGALTGPVARGDIGTVRRHLEALADTPDVLAVYKALGLETIPIAQAKGAVDEVSADALRPLFAMREQEPEPQGTGQTLIPRPSRASGRGNSTDASSTSARSEGAESAGNVARPRPSGRGFPNRPNTTKTKKTTRTAARLGYGG